MADGQFGIEWLDLLGPPCMNLGTMEMPKIFTSVLDSFFTCQFFIRTSSRHKLLNLNGCLGTHGTHSNKGPVDGGFIKEWDKKISLVIKVLAEKTCFFAPTVPATIERHS